MRLLSFQQQIPPKSKTGRSWQITLQRRESTLLILFIEVMFSLTELLSLASDLHFATGDTFHAI